MLVTKHTFIEITTLTRFFASASQNGQKHAPNLLEKTKLLLKRAIARLKRANADKQYSNSKLRRAVEETVVSYGVNQERDFESLLSGES
jgi:hypothetical protein